MSVAEEIMAALTRLSYVPVTSHQNIWIFDREQGLKLAEDLVWVAEGLENCIVLCRRIPGMATIYVPEFEVTIHIEDRESGGLRLEADPLRSSDLLRILQMVELSPTAPGDSSE